MKRTIFITDDINDSRKRDINGESLVHRVTSEFIKCLLESEEEPINIMIDTKGGYLVTAIYIYEMLRSSPAPIHTYALSEVASAGILILLAGDKRTAFKHTELMMHPSIRSVETSASDFKSISNAIVDSENVYKDIFKKRTKSDEKTYKKLHESVNIMWASEAKKLGIITHIQKWFPVNSFQVDFYL